MFRVIKKAMIDFICICMQDSRLVLQIIRFLYMADKPTARKHLDHYLKGNGTDIIIDTQTLFAEDLGVSERFFKEVQKKINSGEQNGKIQISQFSYTNKNWLCALGTVTINWEICGDNVKYWFKEKYRWHPNEPRITQSVHKAAYNLQRKGAKNFFINSKPAFTDITTVMNRSCNKDLFYATMYLL